MRFPILSETHRKIIAHNGFNAERLAKSISFQKFGHGLEGVFPNRAYQLLMHHLIKATDIVIAHGHFDETFDQVLRFHTKYAHGDDPRCRDKNNSWYTLTSISFNGRLEVTRQNVETWEEFLLRVKVEEHDSRST